jgi:small subunit ribosomal protein S2
MTSQYEVDIKQLFESGAHFGHKTSRWHPMMAQYIHSKKAGVHIIDLEQTAQMLEAALLFIEKTAANGKQVLFINTKKQFSDTVKITAESVDMPYVTNRWLGGMMTNQKTIGGRISHLKKLESRMESGELAAKYSKLEVQRFAEEITEMNYLYGGVKNLGPKAGCVIVIDINADKNGVAEAVKLGIPVVAFVDTNVDPRGIDYPVACNDDSHKTVELVMEMVAKAINNGKNTKAASKSEETTQEAK